MFAQTPVFVDQCAPDRVCQTARPDTEYFQGRSVVDYGFIPETLHQLAADPGVDGCDQAQPETGQPGRQNGNGNHLPAQASLKSILLHDVGIRSPFGSSDLNDAASFERGRERGEQVFDNVFHGNGLRHGADPARRQHEGQLLHERPDHLEGKASRADDDGGPEFNRGNAGTAENSSHLLPASKVAGEALAAAQAAQVNDAPHTRFPGGG